MGKPENYSVDGASVVRTLLVLKDILIDVPNVPNGGCKFNVELFDYWRIQMRVKEIKWWASVIQTLGNR